MFVGTDRVAESQLQPAREHGLPTDIDVLLCLRCHLIIAEFTSPDRACLIDRKGHYFSLFRVKRVIRGIPHEPHSRSGKNSLPLDLSQSTYSGGGYICDVVVFQRVYAND